MNATNMEAEDNAQTGNDLEADKARIGPPVGSANGLTHGEKATFRFTLSKVPAKRLRQYRNALAFRAVLVQAVEARYGSVSLTRSLIIDTASVAHLRGLLVEAYLRDEDGKLSHSDYVSLTDRTIRFREARDRAVERLSIDVESEAPRSILEAAASF